MPALLFGLMAEADVSFGMSLVYLAATLAVYVFALWIGRWLADASLPHRAIFALDATFGNVVFLGVPLISAVWGKEGLAHLIGVIVVTTLLIPITSILVELSGTRRAGQAGIGGMMMGLAKNPAINSVVLGFLWRMTGLPLPGPIHDCLDLLARAAAPIALFCLGTSLPAMSRAVLREGAAGAALKLVVLPVVVALAVYQAGYTDAVFAVAVLVAGLPTGVNAFLIARGATSHGEASATTVVMATMLSLLTLPTILYLLR